MARPEWIEVGRVSRPHGVRGEVRIIPDSDNPERFADGSVLYARPWRAGMTELLGRERTRLTIEAVRGDCEFPIVAFRDIGDRDAAEALRGHVLEVRAAELPDLADGEFYPFDLEGLAVKDPQGAVLGRVAEVIDSPAHGLLAVALESGQEVLVPFVSAAVPMVSLGEGYLVVEPRFLETAGAAAGDQDALVAERGSVRADRGGGS